MNLIFVLSLPRSGSTLLQRVLGLHPQIATIAEPWLLLPICYSLREHGITAPYDHSLLVQATKDLCNHLPRGKDDYLESFGNAVKEIFRKIAPTEKYFLDKSPRYHLILDDLFTIFPDAKILVLWRNPLAIAASMMETWSSGRWNLHRFYVDLYEGIDNLVKFSQIHADKILTVNFETFLSEPHSETKKITDYLDIEYNTSLINDFYNYPIEGYMGDKTGVYQYDRITTNSINKWRKTLSNSLRKKWAKKYINEIGMNQLNFMGYDKKGLEKLLKETPTSSYRLYSDIYRIPYSCAYHLVNRLYQCSLTNRR